MPRLVAWLAGGAVLVPFTAGLILVASLAPDLHVRWHQEDGWVEWTTFVAFAAAGVIALRCAVDAGTKGRWVFAALSAFCLFVAGEEISWGHRLFAFEPPEIFLERNFQQEANVHNLFKHLLDTRWMVLAVALTYGVIAPGIALAWKRLRPLAPSPVLVPYFATVVVLEAEYPFKLTGELAEAVLGLAFVGDVVMRQQAGAGPALSIAALRSAAIQGAAIVTGLALMPIVDRVAYGANAQTRGDVERQLELLATDLERGALRQRIARKRSVHKRIFTAVRAGYLGFGTKGAFLERQATPAEIDDDARRDARGYFLDGWSQPYWIYFRRLSMNRGRVVLYSFGPNRRRDSHLVRIGSKSPREIFMGDDIGVVLDVSLLDGRVRRLR